MGARLLVQFIIDEMDYINLMLNYWDKNIPIIWVGLIKTYKGKLVMSLS